jgi:nucleoside-diphosphate-sugar epimerase
MEKILLTGATGFIGSNLLSSLPEKDYKIYALIRNPSKLSIPANSNVEIIKGDLQDSDLKIPEVDYVYHVAGLTKARYYKEFYNVNYSGTINLIKLIKKQKNPVRSFIYLSSLAINGDPEEKVITNESKNTPMTHYAKSKLLAEEHVLEHKNDFNVVVVRPTAVYGPGEKEMYNYFKLLKKGYAPVLNDKGIFSFIYVTDLVNILLTLLKKEIKSGEILLASDGNSYTWYDVISIASKKLGVQPKTFKIPKIAVYLAAASSTFLNLFKKNPSILTIDKLKEIFKISWFCDITHLKKITGYTPVYNLDRGLELTLKWYNTNRWL